MPDLLDILFTFRWGIAGALIMAAIGAYLVGLNNRRNRAAEAAIKFRQTILDALEGWYPDTKYWNRYVDMGVFSAISKIDVAVSEYGYFLRDRRRVALNNTWTEAKKCYQQINWDKCAAYSMYPSMRKPGERDPRDIFKEYTDNLLSYAKDK